MIPFYAEDSFFTLSIVERAGLVVLSSCLMVLVANAVWRLARPCKLPGKLALALAVYWAFLWLSPQVYYVYYMTLFPNLPAQNVIAWPPTPLDLFNLLAFREQPNMSAHARGVLGWGLAGLILFQSWLQPWAKKRA